MRSISQLIYNKVQHGLSQIDLLLFQLIFDILKLEGSVSHRYLVLANIRSVRSLKTSSTSVRLLTDMKCSPMSFLAAIPYASFSVTCHSRLSNQFPTITLPTPAFLYGFKLSIQCYSPLKLSWSEASNKKTTPSACL